MLNLETLDFKSNVCYYKSLFCTWFDEMHAMVTVCAGILSLNPAPNAASLATLESVATSVNAECVFLR